MIKAHRIYDLKPSQIVSVGNITSMPADNIQGRVIYVRNEKLIHELINQFEITLFVFKCGHGRLEVTRHGKTVGTIAYEMRKCFEPAGTGTAAAAAGRFHHSTK